MRLSKIYNEKTTRIVTNLGQKLIFASIFNIFNICQLRNGKCVELGPKASIKAPVFQHLMANTKTFRFAELSAIY